MNASTINSNARPSRDWWTFQAPGAPKPESYSTDEVLDMNLTAIPQEGLKATYHFKTAPEDAITTEQALSHGFRSAGLIPGSLGLGGFTALGIATGGFLPCLIMGGLAALGTAVMGAGFDALDKSWYQADGHCVDGLLKRDDHNQVVFQPTSPWETNHGSPDPHYQPIPLETYTATPVNDDPSQIQWWQDYAGKSEQPNLARYPEPVTWHSATDFYQGWPVSER